MNLINLSDDCLLEVLDRLPAKELFKMQRVNKRLKQLAAIKMNVKIKKIIFSYSYSFFNCAHLGKISPDQVLDFSDFLKVEDDLETLQESYKQLILTVLSKCAGVKSIIFGHVNLPDGFLLDVVRVCKELECIHLASSVVNEEEWDQVMDVMGHRMVHFARENYFITNKIQKQSEIYLIEKLATNGPNIQRVDWSISPYHFDWPVTSDFMSAFKSLPKRCWISLQCSCRFEDVIEDVFDALDISLKLSKLGNRYDRLSKLRFETSRGESRFPGIEFNGLKKLDFVMSKRHDKTFNCFLASRFPQLEELCFHINARFTENEYRMLFQKMKTLKKLNLSCTFHYKDREPPPKLPRSAIHELKNLEIMVVNISIIFVEWQPEAFLYQLGRYVDDISSLKKLTVEVDGLNYEEAKRMVEDEVSRLKIKQNRVEVDLV